jgi:hypothetical protein
MYDARHRCSAALTAYVPIATRIFRSHFIGPWLKLHFMSSLVLSRLLYNTQTWVQELPAMRKINGVYMRVLRRILGDCRYGPCVFSDLEVRRQLGQPSIDCLLLRRRMHYLRRLVHHRHKSLIEVLSLVHDGTRIPWVDLICRDI